MSGRRDRIALFLIALLLLALPAVGVLQFHLLTLAAQAEEDDLRRAASIATAQIRNDIAYDLAALMTIFGTDADAGAAPARLEALFNAWAGSARFPELVRSVATVADGRAVAYAARHDAGEVTLHAYEPGADDPFAPLVAAADEAARVSVSTTDPLVVRVPAVWLRIASESAESAQLPVTDREIYLAVDGDRLAGEIIPALVGEYLGGTSRGLQATVVDLNDRSVVFTTREVDPERFLVRGEDDGSAGNARDAITVDASALLNAWPGGEIVLSGEPRSRLLVASSAERPEVVRATQNPLVRQWLALREADGPEGNSAHFTLTVGPSAANGIPDSGLALLVWHAAGSIERAALRDRNRNFAVSVLVLAALAGVAAVFYALFRRAQRQREREQEFVASVTHELRTPVAAMHAAAENLAAGIVTGESRVREYGRALVDEGRRLRRMIDQTLLYARLQSRGSATREVIDLEDVTRRAIRTVAPAKPGAITVRVEPQVPPYLGDRAAVESIVTNLLANAVHHNPPGTPVTVSAAYDDVDGRRVLRIAVADKGEGIARAEVARVREPFYRGQRSRELQTPGTGLGLAIVQRIVTIGGGKLDIESIEGRGTTVTVLLPYRV